MTRHPDAVDFGKLPIPTLLLLRWHRVEHARLNPGEKKKTTYKRWETVLLSAMLRQCRPIERCCDCGCYLDRHPGWCPSEVAA